MENLHSLLPCLMATVALFLRNRAWLHMHALVLGKPAKHDRSQRTVQPSTGYAATTAMHYSLLWAGN